MIAMFHISFFFNTNHPYEYTSFLVVVGSRNEVYPVVVAAHPKNPNQFAVGLSNGGIHIFEPLESVRKWTASLPVVDLLNR